MKLQKILNKASKDSLIKKSPIWLENPEIRSICFHSKEATKQSIFFAIKGLCHGWERFYRRSF